MLIFNTRPTILQNETKSFNMKTILSTVLFLFSSFFISAQEFDLIVESDFCNCAYFEVVGEEIQFLDVEFQITDGSGFFLGFQGNPYEFCDFGFGSYTVTAIVSINGNIFWEGASDFYIFSSFIEIFPTSICEQPINTSSGNCATAYANELATYSAFNPNGSSIWGFDVFGGEIISQNQYEVTVLWGDTGQGHIYAFDDCSEGYLCVNIEAVSYTHLTLPTKA